MLISASNTHNGMPPVADSLILELQGLRAGYGEIQVLWGIDMAVRRGEITALIGSNGAGKTTLMRALSGLIPMQDGNYFSEGRDLTGDTAAQILAHGIVHVPEGRRLFGAMSIEDNLLMGAYSRKASRAEIARNMERVYTTFPKLLERRNQAAATLSGGEQQMCAIGRGLMSAPRLLMIDELSLGLSPLLVEQLVAALRTLNSEGMSILLVEQDVTTALDLCHSAYIMDMGRIVRTGLGPELLADPIIRDAYLGVLED
ncbi:branched-chain amino acid transport system ATP-binding protein [Nitrobacteraceae bacterium AZCC 2146]